MDMSLDKLGPIVRRRRRPLMWVGGTLTVYALLGFLLLPWLAERQLVNTLQRRLGAAATVEAIRFNPFTFTASVTKLDVHAADSTPLLSLGQFYLNLQPLRLLLLKVRLEDITIDSLQLHYTRYSAADDTLKRLAQQWAATAEPDEEVAEQQADSGLFPLEIGRFRYLNGNIVYRDEVPQTDFDMTLGPLNIDVANISTLDTEEKGIKDLVLQLEQDATLTWNSTFDISPLEFAGHLALANFSFTTPYRYLQDTLPFALTDGRLSVDLDYAFNVDEAGPHLAISNIGMQVSALHAVQNGMQAAFLADGTVALENGSFLYPEMRAEAAALRIDGMKLALERDAQGMLNLQAMLDSMNGNTTIPAAPAPAPAPVAAAATPPASNAASLQLTLNEFTVANTSVSFLDQTTQTPASFSVQVQAGLQNFTLLPESALPFNATVTLESGGALTTQGNLQLFPAIDVDTQIELTELALLPLQPYIDQYAQVTLESGTLGVAAQLRTNSSETLSWQGDVTLADLQLADRQRSETLLRAAALRIGNVDLSVSNRRLDISELIVDAPYGRVLIDENGVTNIGEALTPASAAASAVQDAAAADVVTSTAQPTEIAEPIDDAAAPFAIAVGRMQINDASSDFTDLSLPIVFDTKMAALNGEISGFSSSSSQAMTVNLEGQVDEFGLVEITGALNPMNITEQTRIELMFTNLNMPAMTPYVIKFAGREIAEGNIDVQLAYTIDDSALQASNSVTIRDMRLGERVDYPDAMDLPLDLAVALLKNREGVIDLDVPITGNVDDPQFDFGPVIRQAIFNVLGNIVTAPFRFLGSLIGGEAEQIDNIRFRPGRSDLAPPEQEKLQKLIEALSQRPQLALVIPAPFESAADTAALQIAAVDARIEAQLAEDASDAQLAERQLAVQETLYTAAMLTPTLEELRLEFTTTPPVDAEQDDDDAEPVFDALAYSADLRERLIAAEPVTSQMLDDLARARQTTVSTYLVMTGAITEDRLQMQDVAAVVVEDDWLSAMFDVDATD